MAKRQTRRTVSLSRATYDAITAQAALEGMSASEWVTELARTRIPSLPAQAHMRAASGAEIIERARAFNVMSASDVSAVLAANGRATPSRLDLDALAARRRSAGVAPGTLCANCVECKATHLGRVDHSGDVFPLCDACELPKEEGRA